MWVGTFVREVVKDGFAGRHFCYVGEELEGQMRWVTFKAVMVRFASICQGDLGTCMSGATLLLLECDDFTLPFICPSEVSYLVRKPKAPPSFDQAIFMHVA